jgi:hypothetical protein
MPRARNAKPTKRAKAAAKRAKAPPAKKARSAARAQPAPASAPYEISDRVERQALLRPYQREPGAPVSRPLRIYSLDPSVSDRLGGVATVLVPYEKLEPGPVGSLFKVDTTGAPKQLAAEILNLDDPYLLLSSGLSPSPSNGRFHAQMTYAVCSLTYAVFRRALGRDIAWSTPQASGEPLRLVVKPFGFEGHNAGFNRETGDLSFGFFTARGERAGFTLRDGIVCTSLSHDVIAHETTHALLDGLRSSFLTPTNVDVPAFHEAFSDLVALFLHFTYPEMVERAIRDSRGGLSRGSLLTDIAREFGYARSRSDRAQPLRSGVDVDGIAAFDSDVLPSATGQPSKYDPSLDPHLLGSVLVSAVFEAFATIVRRKTERLFQIAGVDGNAPGGPPLSDALIKAIAQEASDMAGRFLDICIRAIDYCPPTDMELGEYLRALITADADVEPTDKYGFREALMRSFRRRDIFPDHVRFMTEDAVRWERADPLRVKGLAFKDLRFDGDPGRPASPKELRRQANALGTFVTDPKNASRFHLVSPNRKPANIVQASPPRVESVRVSRRASPDGRIVFDLVAEVAQSCTANHNGELFDMNGGCTILLDPEGVVRYAIYKKFTSENRRARQHAAISGPLAALWEKSGSRYHLRSNVLTRIHDMALKRSR